MVGWGVLITVIGLNDYVPVALVCSNFFFLNASWADDTLLSLLSRLAVAIVPSIMHNAATNSPA